MCTESSDPRGNTTSEASCRKKSDRSLRVLSDRSDFLPAAKPRRSMDGKMSVGGTGVVHFLGIFCEIELKSNSDISN